MKKWENPNLINLSVKNTTKQENYPDCGICGHNYKPNRPNHANHTGWCSIVGGSGSPDAPGPS